MSLEALSIPPRQLWFSICWSLCGWLHKLGIGGLHDTSPQSTLMTVPDSRRGRNKTRSMTYGRDKLSSAAMTKKWNRVKLRCRQPFNLTDQFGLQFVAISSDIADSSSPVLLTPPLTPRLLSPSTPTLPTSTSTTPESENVIARHGKRFPTLPNIKSPAVSSDKNDQVKVSTPKRPLREHSNICEEDFEFSGVEKQSRRFRHALRGNSLWYLLREG